MPLRRTSMRQRGGSILQRQLEGGDRSLGRWHPEQPPPPHPAQQLYTWNYAFMTLLLLRSLKWGGANPGLRQTRGIGGRGQCWSLLPSLSCKMPGRCPIAALYLLCRAFKASAGTRMRIYSTRGTSQQPARAPIVSPATRTRRAVAPLAVHGVTRSVSDVSVRVGEDCDQEVEHHHDDEHRKDDEEQPRDQRGP